MRADCRCAVDWSKAGYGLNPGKPGFGIHNSGESFIIGKILGGTSDRCVGEKPCACHMLVGDVRNRWKAA